jgi:hypothetical protein
MKILKGQIIELKEGTPKLRYGQMSYPVTQKWARAKISFMPKTARALFNAAKIDSEKWEYEGFEECQFAHWMVGVGIIEFIDEPVEVNLTEIINA